MYALMRLMMCNKEELKGQFSIFLRFNVFMSHLWCAPREDKKAAKNKSSSSNTSEKNKKGPTGFNNAAVASPIDLDMKSIINLQNY